MFGLVKPCNGGLQKATILFWHTLNRGTVAFPFNYQTLLICLSASSDNFLRGEISSVAYKCRKPREESPLFKLSTSVANLLGSTMSSEQQPLDQIHSFAFEASRKLSERSIVLCMPAPLSDTQPLFNTSETQFTWICEGKVQLIMTI